MMPANQLAIVSRIVVIALQSIANWLVPDHDAGVFKSPVNAPNETICDRVCDVGLGGFRRWDAEYFLHIAEHGYTYENTLAFYPLYPFIVRYAMYLIRAVLPIDVACAERNQLLVVAVILNVFFFAKATNALYTLTVEVFKDRRMARIAVTLFSFNPASIFFSAPYTESLFAWLCFSVMLECKRNRFIAAALPLAASIWCRSNGLINVGFVAFYLVKQTRGSVTSLIKSTIKMTLMALVAFGAFAAIHVYFYSLYCTEYHIDLPSHVAQYARDNELIAIGSGTPSPWCHQSLPISYGYIQSTYWNVGLFNYYEFKQIPNFLLATPMLIIILVHCTQYIAKAPRILMTLGLIFIKGIDTHQFVFVVHAFVLAIFCLLFVHIQVTTRMLASSSPCLYWFAATHFTHNNSLREMLQTRSRTARIIVTWFASYYFIGTILFCNFLPWT